MNNQGWGLRAMLAACAILLLCLIFSIAMLQKNFDLALEEGRINDDSDTNNQTDDDIVDYDTYDEIEEAMKNAAIKYVSKYYNSGLEENDNITVTLASLKRENYIDYINDIKDESIKCSGYVTFIKQNNIINYSPYLKCGKKYETKGYIERLDSIE